jgi:hypothetical protein
MNQYTITIKKNEYTEEDKYPKSSTVYEQVISEEEMTKGRLLGIIKAVNDLPDYKN